MIYKHKKGLSLIHFVRVVRVCVRLSDLYKASMVFNKVHVFNRPHRQKKYREDNGNVSKSKSCNVMTGLLCTVVVVLLL